MGGETQTGTETPEGTVSGAAEGDGPGSTSGESGAADESPAQDAGAKEYRSYLVEPGDTLVNICWKIYGYRDDAIIEEICEVNRLSDKDHIYAGQELLIP